MDGFSASIKVLSSSPEEKDQLQKLFKTEDSLLSNGRASYSLVEKADDLIFEISADDAVALRAILNAVCKTLTVFEKMQKIE